MRFVGSVMVVVGVSWIPVVLVVAVVLGMSESAVVVVENHSPPP
jgi:hypothetical protein